MHKLFDLTGRIAIVTNCASEIGKEMTQALAEAGADIIGIDKKPTAEVESMVKEHGRCFTSIKADLTDTDSIPWIVDHIVDRYRKIDILIAYSNEQDSGEEPENVSWDEYLHLVDANQNAMVRLSILAYAQMKEQADGGKIIIVSSALAERTSSDTLAYTITKNAVLGLMRTLSIAGAQHNIWVNAIAPGMIETSAVRAIPEEVYAELDKLAERMGMGAMKIDVGKPSNLRGVAVFLASQASDYTVGQIIRVDGGFTTRL